MTREILDPIRKALTINLNPKIYGSFAEIGAGQEVARYFFKAGAAAGTIAKSMSAYDMNFSDSIYGPETTGRYVCESRLKKMLNHEFELIKERIWDKRQSDTMFFVFANTVAAKSFKSNKDCHGWLGVKFQDRQKQQPNQIAIHVRMFDHDLQQQQDALGIVGVNLLYACFYHLDQPHAFLESLHDNLSRGRIEIDLIRFTGPDVSHIDNRLMSLGLLELGLANSALFDANGEVQQASDVLYKKTILIQRGHFRPVSHVHVDMATTGRRLFETLPENKNEQIVHVMELTLNNLLTEGKIDHQDFLDRVDNLSSLGYNVLISNYSEYYRLAAYLRRFTPKLIGLVMGISSLKNIFDESYYTGLDGGILEAFGKLFQNNMRLMIYPQLEGNDVVTGSMFQAPKNLEALYQHLWQNGFLREIKDFNAEVLKIDNRNLLKKIQKCEAGWENLVPAAVVAAIQKKQLFGYCELKK